MEDLRWTTPGLGDLEPLLRPLLGRPLTGAQCWMLLEPDDQPRLLTLEERDARLLEVDMGVWLGLDGDSLQLDWLMFSHVQGMTVEVGTPLPPDWSEQDLLAGAPWRDLVGRRLLSIDVWWHQAELLPPDVPVGMTLHLDEGRTISVALGTLAGGRAEYQPDALLVFFDLDRASAYLGSLEPRWISTVGPDQARDRRGSVRHPPSDGSSGGTRTDVDAHCTTG